MLTTIADDFQLFSNCLFFISAFSPMSVALIWSEVNCHRYLNQHFWWHRVKLVIADSDSYCMLRIIVVCFQGTIIVQPEDATDSPFQGPEFCPIGSFSSGER